MLDKGNFKVEFNLPEIVVVGDQSSGKSSVLESISRISLPKGEGMVTRCPLKIQLRNTTGEECALIWTGDENESQAVRVDLANISSVIDQKQKDMTQVGGKISSEPIYLRINKHNFFDLTLVDLPGLVYVDKLGPLIKGLYEKFIKNPNAIVLYVTSATTDLTTGQSMEIIDDIDSEWQRTLTIITKIDGRDGSFTNKFRTVDKGLGAICVRNRSQAELNEGISFNEVLNREQVILADPDFAEIPEE